VKIDQYVNNKNKQKESYLVKAGLSA